MPSIENIYPLGSKIGFVGLGRSNFPIAEILLSKGYEISLRDKKPQPEKQGYRCFFGDSYLDSIYEDILFVAPVIRPDIPELVKAKENGVYVTNEINEYFSHRKGKVIAVTGSDGKSTTTTLISEILKASGVKTVLGGNIGINLFKELENEDENTVTVCELSSFQLMKAVYPPDIAVITNVSPNHLDWHKGMEEYIDAKKNIFRFMKSGKCVLCADDSVSMSFAHQVPVKTLFTSQAKKENSSVWFDENGIYTESGMILCDIDILLPGKHNRYNYCEAIAATLEYASRDAVLRVARTFPGVPHRCQFIRELDGVRYYNSSMDSSPTRTAACLNSFNKKVIVIAGGYDKKIPLEPLGSLFEDKSKAVILMGVTGEKIYKILNDIHYSGQVFRVESMPEAVQTASLTAQSGDIVVLSPAAASFGLFKDFQERGEIFVDCVNGLKHNGDSI